MTATCDICGRMFDSRCGGFVCESCDGVFCPECEQAAKPVDESSRDCAECERRNNAEVRDIIQDHDEDEYLVTEGIEQRAVQVGTVEELVVASWCKKGLNQNGR